MLCAVDLMAESDFKEELKLLRQPNFAKGFFAYLVSYSGTAMAPIAMAFGVLELTGSTADTGRFRCVSDACSTGDCRVVHFRRGNRPAVGDANSSQTAYMGRISAGVYFCPGADGLEFSFSCLVDLYRCIHNGHWRADIWCALVHQYAEGCTSPPVVESIGI
jgi:hypothetical protein